MRKPPPILLIYDLMRKCKMPNGDYSRVEGVLKVCKRVVALEEQINAFNEGKFIDGTPIQAPLTPFRYGVLTVELNHRDSVSYLCIPQCLHVLSPLLRS